MIKHIVFWKLRDDLQGAARDERLHAIKEGFEKLQGVIPGLRHIEVGFDFLRTPESVDIVLYSEFESREALEGYANHPGHLAMLPVVREVRIERRSGDYEVR
ncbi:MAG: Dabb family protein [Acidimicrobiia bacterium]|nr:Dabb family protein [Acidimicrobiia bacterium]